MTSSNAPSSDGDHRVVSFRRRDQAPASTPQGHKPPVEDLSKYEREPDEPDDYRHRMIVNVVAFLFIVALVGAGIWLADSMARMRHTQDCFLSGRRDCAPVAVERSRW